MAKPKTERSAGAIEIVSVGLLVVGGIMAGLNGQQYMAVNAGSPLTGSISEARKMVASHPHASRVFFSDGYVDQAAEVFGNLQKNTLAQNRFVKHVSQCVIAPVLKAQDSSKIYAWAAACAGEQLHVDACHDEGLCGTIIDTSGVFGNGACTGIDLSKLINKFEEHPSPEFDQADLHDLMSLPFFDFTDPYKQVPHLKQLMILGSVLAVCGLLGLCFCSVCACVGKNASARAPQGDYDFQALAAPMDDA